MKIRTLISSFAILVALGASIAMTHARDAESVNNQSLLSVTVSLPAPSDCENIGSCTLGGSTLCKTPFGATVIRYFVEIEACGPPFNGTWDF